MIDLGKLNDIQREAVEDTEGVMRIVAGAGSGKTRVITYRIANLLDRGVSPSRILAITFTTKAAKEMRERASALAGESAEGVWLLTFHSLCFRILRAEISCFGKYSDRFSVYDEEDSENVVAAAMDALGVDVKEYPVSFVAGWISRHKGMLHTAERLKNMAWEKEFDAVCYRVYAEYQARLERNNALDYDDLLLLTVGLFIKNPEVRLKWRDRFDYMFVDEYQDTDYAQYVLLRALFRENLCVVGDTDQSIYSFRGADTGNIESFTKDFPDVKTIVLEQNYRSTQTILNAANAVIANNTGRQMKILWTDSGKGSLIHRVLGGEVRAEAKMIAETVEEQTVEGYGWGDIAVLYRMNSQSQQLEKAFIKAHIPYVIIGGVPFSRRKEVKDFVAYLRVLDNPSDDVSAMRILRFPKRGMGEASIDKVMEYASMNGISFYEACVRACCISGLSDKVRKVLKDTVGLLEEIKTLRLSPVETVKVLRKRLGYPDVLKAVEKDESQARQKDQRIRMLQRLAKDFSTMPAFLDEIATLEDDDDTDGKVKLMTVHAAKGLEFPVVILPDLDEEVFPCKRAMEEDGVEEERRLFYVAVTRAMYRLYLFGSRYRFITGEKRLEKRVESRFIKEIPTELLQDDSVPDTVSVV